MTRSDLPYLLLTVLSGATIFAAGRYSVPTPAALEPRVVVVRDAMAAPPPSVVLIASKPEPPLALLPEVTPVAAPASAAPKVVVEEPKRAPVAPSASTPVPAVSVFLEETSDVPANPYKTSKTPGF